MRIWREKSIEKDCVFLFLSQLNFGGQERFVSHLDKILQDKYQVYIVLFDASSVGYEVSGTILDIKSDAFSEKRLISRIKKVFLRCRKLRQFLKEYKPVACISFGIGPNYINLLCRKKGIRTIPSVRGYASAERLIKNPLAKILYKRADVVVCVSKGIEQKLYKEFGLKRERLTTIYNAYEVDTIRLKARERHKKINEAGGFPYIVSVGTLRPEKGYWHLIKATKLLKEQYPDIRVSIVGEDYLDNGERMGSLIRKLDLDKNVFLEGYSKYPYEYMYQSNIYVLSSVREGFPNALVEAMACGKPVIASDCKTGPEEILWDNGQKEGIAESVVKADYGILVRGMNEEENYSENIEECDRLLADAIMMMLGDSGLSNHYEDMSVKRARKFSYKECGAKYDAVIRGAVK